MADKPQSPSASPSDGSLARYRAKRAVDSTPEPFGGSAVSGAGVFVVQHHAARRVHYDLRLEMEGVLRSWAVPKGPSPNPEDKRLAVLVEDHPLEYGGFEGRIPEGNYGAGAVILWDRGSWKPLADPLQGLAEGKLLFELNGYKLRGRWTLVKTKQDWLLIKERDVYASELSTEDYPADSILSGRTVVQLQTGADLGESIRGQLAGGRDPAPPKRVNPNGFKVMLAQTGEPFTAEGWLFEIKYDGYRLLVVRDGHEVHLYSRAGNDLTASFPEIGEAVGRLPYDYLVMDGEVVVHDERGIPSFPHLARRAKLERPSDIQRATVRLPATLYAFDLVGFEDFDLRSLPVVERKAYLKWVLPSVGPLRFSDHIEREGERMYNHICEVGLEGLVAKRADATYESGRSAAWVKIVREHTDDFVVVGYTDPKGQRTEFGALLLAQYDDGAALRYVGRAGSGFNAASQREIAADLKALEPLAREAVAGAPEASDQHWVVPELVCEARYKQVTPDGVLRQPVFLRLREDKPPRECVLTVHGELPEPAPVVDTHPGTAAVAFSNLTKIYWPNEGYTKGELIDYYRAVAPWILPYLQDRPVVMDRYPDGITGKSFFQKDAPPSSPEWLRLETIWSEGVEREIRYFVVDDEPSLLYLVNLGSIPLHIWASRIGLLERPDWCLIDLDPKEADFSRVVEVANAFGRLCRRLELPAFVKTSGSSGLHILVPLGQSCTYEQARTFGELLARVVLRDHEKIATLARRPTARQGRVYIDVVQNGQGRLMAAPYCARPLPGAPVSMPLTWREVNRNLTPRQFTIRNAVRRLRSRKRDPWAGLLSRKPDLTDALSRLAESVQGTED